MFCIPPHAVRKPCTMPPAANTKEATATPLPVGLQRVVAKGSVGAEPKRSAHASVGPVASSSSAAADEPMASATSPPSSTASSYVKLGSAMEAVALIEAKLRERALNAPPGPPPGTPPGWNGPPPPEITFKSHADRKRVLGSQSSASQPSGSSATSSSLPSMQQSKPPSVCGEDEETRMERILRADEPPKWPLAACATCPTVSNWKKMFSILTTPATDDTHSIVS